MMESPSIGKESAELGFDREPLCEDMELSWTYGRLQSGPSGQAHDLRLSISRDLGGVDGAGAASTAGTADTASPVCSPSPDDLRRHSSCRERFHFEFPTEVTSSNGKSFHPHGNSRQSAVSGSTGETEGSRNMTSVKPCERDESKILIHPWESPVSTHTNGGTQGCSETESITDTYNMASVALSISEASRSDSGNAASQPEVKPPHLLDKQRPVKASAGEETTISTSESSHATEPLQIDIGQDSGGVSDVNDVVEQGDNLQQPQSSTNELRLSIADRVKLFLQKAISPGSSTSSASHESAGWKSKTPLSKLKPEDSWIKIDSDGTPELTGGESRSQADVPSREMKVGMLAASLEDAAHQIPASASLSPGLGSSRGETAVRPTDVGRTAVSPQERPNPVYPLPHGNDVEDKTSDDETAAAKTPDAKDAEVGGDDAKQGDDKHADVKGSNAEDDGVTKTDAEYTAVKGEGVRSADFQRADGVVDVEIGAIKSTDAKRAAVPGLLGRMTIPPPPWQRRREAESSQKAARKSSTGEERGSGAESELADGKRKAPRTGSLSPERQMSAVDDDPGLGSSALLANTIPCDEATSRPTELTVCENDIQISIASLNNNMCHPDELGSERVVPEGVHQEFHAPPTAGSETAASECDALYENVPATSGDCNDSPEMESDRVAWKELDGRERRFVVNLGDVQGLALDPDRARAQFLQLAQRSEQLFRDRWHRNQKLKLPGDGAASSASEECYYDAAELEDEIRRAERHDVWMRQELESHVEMTLSELLGAATRKCDVEHAQQILARYRSRQRQLVRRHVLAQDRWDSLLRQKLHAAKSRQAGPGGGGGRVGSPAPILSDDELADSVDILNEYEHILNRNYDDEDDDNDESSCEGDNSDSGIGVHVPVKRSGGGGDESDNASVDSATECETFIMKSSMTSDLKTTLTSDISANFSTMSSEAFSARLAEFRRQNEALCVVLPADEDDVQQHVADLREKLRKRKQSEPEDNVMEMTVKPQKICLDDEEAAVDRGTGSSTGSPMQTMIYLPDKRDISTGISDTLLQRQQAAGVSQETESDGAATSRYTSCTNAATSEESDKLIAKSSESAKSVSSEMQAYHEAALNLEKVFFKDAKKLDEEFVQGIVKDGQMLNVDQVSRMLEEHVKNVEDVRRLRQRDTNACLRQLQAKLAARSTVTPTEEQPSSGDLTQHTNSQSADVSVETPQSTPNLTDSADKIIDECLSLSDSSIEADFEHLNKRYVRKIGDKGGEVSAEEVAGVLAKYRKKQKKLVRSIQARREQFDQKLKAALDARNQPSVTGQDDDDDDDGDAAAMNNMEKNIERMDQEFYQHLCERGMRQDAAVLGEQEMERLVDKHLDKVDRLRRQVSRMVERRRKERQRRSEEKSLARQVRLQQRQEEERKQEADAAAASLLVQKQRDEASQLRKLRERERERTDAMLQLRLQNRT